MKTVLVTGAQGFVGRNFVDSLRRREDLVVREFDVDNPPEQLTRFLGEAEIIYHLAGVNRPPRPEDYESGNVGLTRALATELERRGRRPAIVLASSIQAALDNPYGRSKRGAEQVLAQYAERQGAPVFIFRLPNVFGKWCRPNYNSVVATFCYNSTHGLELTVADAARELQLVYIDDVVQAWLAILEKPNAAGCRMLTVEPVYTATVGQLAERLQMFREIRTRLILPDFSDRFTRCLYATYLSYYDSNDLAYALDQKADQRGRLAELLKSESFGQIFVSRTRPGVVRGHHYHRSKIEKFVVVEGEACIRLRQVDTGRTVSYRVAGGDFKVVDIPPGYAHAVENIGATELIVLFWAGEMFDPALPDTYPCAVSVENVIHGAPVVPREAEGSQKMA